MSVSLSDDDVAILDAYVKRAGLPSRSAGLQHAIRVLRYPTLEDDYANAWQEWSQPATRTRGSRPSATESVMRRGEIWQVDLDPARGSEANNQRPAVVVSNDRANATATRLGRGVITVVPVTSNIAKVYPFQVLLSATTTGLQVDCKAQAEQIRSIATERLLRPIGRVSAAELAQLDEALKLHLDLWS